MKEEKPKGKTLLELCKKYSILRSGMYIENGQYMRTYLGKLRLRNVVGTNLWTVTRLKK